MACGHISHFPFFGRLYAKVAMEELRGGMLVSGHQVQDAGTMRLFAGGVIMTLLGERGSEGGKLLLVFRLCHSPLISHGGHMIFSRS